MLHLLIDRLPLQLHCIFSKLSEIIIVGAERSSLQPPPSRQCTDHIVTGWLPCFKDDNQYHCAHTIVIPDRDFYIPHSDIWWPVCNTMNALFQAWQSISLCSTCSDPPCLHTIVISDRDLHIPHSDIWWPVYNTLFQAWQSMIYLFRPTISAYYCHFR